MQTTKQGGMIPDNDIVVRDSGKSGAVTTVMVGVHGNELAGPLVLEKVIKEIEIFSGKVNFIFANLEALKQNKRFCDVNMNRYFSHKNNNSIGNSYEEKRIAEILPYIEQSDYLLDCHNSTSTVNSVPMLIGEQPEWGQYFDIDLMVTGFNDFQPGASDGYMADAGKVGICLESGNLTDEYGPLRVEKAIYNFLKATKNVLGEPEIYDSVEYNFDINYITQTDSFYLNKEFGDFEEVKKGQLIGTDGSIPVYASYDGVLLFSHNRYAIGEEAFCMGKRVI
ncbi:succinylglutamate desuccinylase/aspartoacylase family protein [Candidatus Gracilibacteria bacterium]|nr:succinylglutamate desuccinylase/aspartoacylase family protein [Candidatus Gracilibacteria bacterium]